MNTVSFLQVVGDKFVVLANDAVLSFQYDNECEMLKAACERNMAISFLHHGPCAGLEAKFGGELLCY